ncbi:MAG: TIGR02147 family protein [Bdellovibrionaceae bacterium]|nr:TIGR02147 family protein [Pseudobdellovibrionaceae bacterium]MBX3033821.1 TIGR02147 family protein [Pseudobdellovibrionaceae bacterium]
MQNPQHEFHKVSENPATSVQVPSVSDYMDYRVYLADWYAHRRKLSQGEIRPYGYQMFSAAANIKSPNYLKMIIEGRRNLSDDMIGKFGKALGLNKEQTEEFRYLVHSSQATDPVDRNVYLKKLSELRVERKLRSGEIDRKTWEKIPNWVAWVVYAMVDQEGVSFDLPTLKRLLRGKATEHEIDESLKGLLASGELSRNDEGVLVKSRHLIESPEDVPVALVRKLQAQLMLLGLESLYQDAPTDREFGTLTLAMTKAEFEEVKFKLRQLRKSVHKDNAIARGQGKGERVYQLNIQLFPVSNRAAGVEEKAVPAARVDLRDLFKSASSAGSSASVDSLLKDARLAAESFVDASKEKS